MFNILFYFTYYVMIFICTIYIPKWKYIFITIYISVTERTKMKTVAKVYVC